MISGVLILLSGAGLVTVLVKIKNDRILDIAESDLDEDVDQALIDQATPPKGQIWDAAE
jgi:hypothetical protein